MTHGKIISILRIEIKGGRVMDNITNVADYIIKRYHELTGECLGEVKLHILLYLTQRESFAFWGKPAFVGDFEGWESCPVSPEVRINFVNGESVVPIAPISDSTQHIASNVIIKYGSLATWKLRELCKLEISWNNSRNGIKHGERGNCVIALSDIQEDAKRVRLYAQDKKIKEPF